MSWKTCVLAAMGALLLITNPTGAQTDGASWEQICPGGGGRLMYPAFDPADSRVLFSASDMGTCYRSDNGGAQWLMYPWHQLNAIQGTGINGRGSWAFDPHHQSAVWVGTQTGLFRSSDRGQSWTLIDGPWRAEGKPTAYGPGQILFSAQRAGLVVATFNSYRAEPGAKVCISRDNGQNWSTAANLPTTAEDRVRAIAFDPRNDGVLIVISTQAVLRTRDSGASWEAIGEGLPAKDGKRNIYDATSGYDGKQWVMYATADSVPISANAVKPGVFSSTDGGEHWQPVEGHGLANDMVKDKAPVYQLIQVAPSDLNRIYVSLSGARGVEGVATPGHANVYRSDDGGKNWRPTLFQHPQHPSFNIANETWTTGQWGWAERAAGLAVDPKNPDRVMVATITGLYLSDNAGQNWQAMHSAPMESTGIRGGGMPVMSTWVYNFDPHVPARHLISMTDFSGFVSQDSGRTWQRRSEGNPWQSNIYNMAFDPRVPGRIWAAASAMHDIPFYSYRNKMHSAPGGVVISEDGGQTWAVAAQDKSLPGAAMTDILLVPGKNGGADTLLVAAMGKGIYVSTDGGKSWAPRNSGLDKSNLSVLKIRSDGAGKLYAITTINMKNASKPVSGAAYVSNDMGESWQRIFGQADAPYLVNITINPHDAKTVSLSVFDQNQNDGTGGVWMTHDAGVTWSKVLNGGTWNTAFSPKNPARMYAASLGFGLKVSDDGGATWWTDMSFPFWRPTGIYFDPAQPDMTYVTCFGGGVLRAQESQIQHGKKKAMTDNN